MCFIIITLGTVLFIYMQKNNRDNDTNFNVLEKIDKLDLTQVEGTTEDNAIDENVTENNATDEKVSDDAKIESSLEMLFSERIKNLTNSEVDYSVFFANTETNKDAKYFADKQTFLKALYEREEIKNIRTNDGKETLKKTPKKKTQEKVGRNDPCPCGSGKKYKQCCGK